MVKTYFVELPQKSNEIFVRIFTDAGRNSEKKDKQGIGHLLDHYINGNIFQRHYNLDTNAHIDRELLWFSLNTTKKNLLKDFSKFLTYVVEPDFTQSELLRFEKQTLINEMKSGKVVLYSALFQKVLEQTLNNYSDVYCEIENVTKFSLEDLARFHQELMSLGSISVIIGGNKLSKVFKDGLLSLINSSFRNNSGNGFSSLVTVGTRTSSINELPKISKGQALVYLAMKTFGFNDERDKRIAVNLALRELRGHSRNSPFLKLRKLGVYTIDYNHWVSTQFGQAIVSIVCMPQVVNAAIGLIMDSLNHLSENGLSKLVIAKHRKRNSDYFKSIRLNNGDYFSDAIDDLLFEGREFGRREAMSYFKKITPELTREVYSKVFMPSNISTIIYK